MLNRIIVMGRLTRDPELRTTQSGTAVTSFTLAVDRDYKGQDGERETDFVDIVAWRSSAEFVSKHFSKGSMAIVDGRLQIRQYTDKEGNKRRACEVVAESVYFGSAKKEGGNSESHGESDDNSYGNSYSGSDYGRSKFEEVDDEYEGDLPF